MITKDTLWKGAIRDFTIDFIRFFFVEYIEDLDLTRQPVFLDKEFQELFPKTSDKNRYVDTLVKVFTKTGEEKWILIHIEIQGYVDKDFAKRMFIYYYRIFERFNKPITSIAVFTDDAKSYLPTSFCTDFMGTQMNFSFNTYKLLDKTIEDFDFPKNPFAILMETAWTSLKKKQSDEDILRIKIALVKKLLKNNYERKQIRQILSFIRYYSNFKNKTFLRKFESALQNVAKNQKDMGIIEGILEQAKSVGRQEGIEKGIERGIEEGMARKDRIAIYGMLEAKIFDIASIANILNISEEYTQKIAKEIEIWNLLKAENLPSEIVEITNTSLKEIENIQNTWSKIQINR